MSLALSVGHTADLSIAYLDQNGNPMIPDSVPDGPPVWTNVPSSPLVDTFMQSSDGLNATLAAIAAGMDTVNVAAIVGGVSFQASLSVIISADTQVLTSIEIQAAVS